ncbi:hypothetical protein PPERSA_10400 [Pseudocohnilembus persalinus]|uniref:Uncharacterized protein n=1 Tax=Pseudocohnilembus persalinus TaxID=266149 RepID=A0A0V0QWD7_PSEPJ|nr:hypothetical protein PPERSA_10400 [Pseudocohnilembus persalinus]|eukprot:KRX06542.1 hypothetical protein PPERSA_10400 [Pseudocohnilembus persalinus]
MTTIKMEKMTIVQDAPYTVKNVQTKTIVKLVYRLLGKEMYPNNAIVKMAIIKMEKMMIVQNVVNTVQSVLVQTSVIVVVFLVHQEIKPINVIAKMGIIKTQKAIIVCLVHLSVKLVFHLINAKNVKIPIKRDSNVNFKKTNIFYQHNNNKGAIKDVIQSVMVVRKIQVHVQNARVKIEKIQMENANVCLDIMIRVVTLKAVQAAKRIVNTVIQKNTAKNVKKDIF